MCVWACFGGRKQKDGPFPHSFIPPSHLSLLTSATLQKDTGNTPHVPPPPAPAHADLDARFLWPKGAAGVPGGNRKGGEAKVLVCLNPFPMQPPTHPPTQHRRARSHDAAGRQQQEKKESKKKKEEEE